MFGFISAFRNSPVRIPGNVLVGYLRGNTILPQSDIGIAVLVGRALLKAYITGPDSLTLWNTNLGVSDEQVEYATGVMNTLHQRWGVKCAPRKSRLQSLINYNVRQAQGVMESFVAMQPAPGTVSDLSGFGRLLYAQDTEGIVKPQIRALDGMWDVTTAAMYSKPGVEAMDAYTAQVLRIKDRSHPVFEQARKDVQHQLGQVVTRSIEAATPAIHQDTGIELTPRTIAMFVMQNQLEFSP